MQEETRAPLPAAALACQELKGTTCDPGASPHSSRVRASPHKGRLPLQQTAQQRGAGEGLISAAVPSTVAGALAGTPSLASAMGWQPLSLGRQLSGAPAASTAAAAVAAAGAAGAAAAAAAAGGEDSAICKALLMTSLCASIVEQQETFSEGVFHKLVADLLLSVMGDEEAHACVQGDLLGPFTAPTGFLLTTKPRVGFSGHPKRKASGHGFTRDFNTGINVPHEVFQAAGKPMYVSVDGYSFVVHVMSAPHKQTMPSGMRFRMFTLVIGSTDEGLMKRLKDPNWLDPFQRKSKGDQTWYKQSWVSFVVCTYEGEGPRAKRRSKSAGSAAAQQQQQMQQQQQAAAVAAAQQQAVDMAAVVAGQEQGMGAAAGMLQALPVEAAAAAFGEGAELLLQQHQQHQQQQADAAAAAAAAAAVAQGHAVAAAGYRLHMAEYGKGEGMTAGGAVDPTAAAADAAGQDAAAAAAAAAAIGGVGPEGTTDGADALHEQQQAAAVAAAQAAMQQAQQEHQQQQHDQQQQQQQQQGSVLALPVGAGAPTAGTDSLLNLMTPGGKLNDTLKLFNAPESQRLQALIDVVSYNAKKQQEAVNATDMAAAMSNAAAAAAAAASLGGGADYGALQQQQQQQDMSGAALGHPALSLALGTMPAGSYLARGAGAPPQELHAALAALTNRSGVHLQGGAGHAALALPGMAAGTQLGLLTFPAMMAAGAPVTSLPAGVTQEGLAVSGVTLPPVAPLGTMGMQDEQQQQQEVQPGLVEGQQVGQ